MIKTLLSTAAIAAIALSASAFAVDAAPAKTEDMPKDAKEMTSEEMAKKATEAGTTSSK